MIHSRRASLAASMAVVLALGEAFVSGAVAQSIRRRAVAVPGSGIDSSFFGIHINKRSSPWPTFSPFGSYRTLGSQIKWADIETCDGGSDPTNACYQWPPFDQWINQARSNGADVMFTLFATPSWASSRGSRCVAAGNPDAGCTGAADLTCVFQQQNGPGVCDPPSDIDAVPGSGRGDGTNKHFRDFVTALVTHAGAGTIRYWEIWNEPNISTEWTGTNAQMVRMARDARTIVRSVDSAARFTTPAVANAIMAAKNWLQPYLLAGGGDLADVVAFHGYVQSGACPDQCPVPENEITLVNNVRSVAAAAGQQNKPLFDTEVSWGEKSGFTDAAARQAFTGRMYLLSMSSGVARLYWYGLDFAISSTGGSGEFWAPSGNPDGCGVAAPEGGDLCPAGVAVQQIARWMIGAQFSSPCTPSGTTWTCGLTAPGGYQAIAVWDTSGTTVLFPVPAQYIRLRTLDGTALTMDPAPNRTIPAGASPILLENFSRN
jgi:hypothetical protein